MSREIQNINKVKPFEHDIKSHQNIKPKVDINDLLNRVRDEKKKERKENLLFLGLIGSVIIVTGIIASL